MAKTMVAIFARDFGVKTVSEIYHLGEIDRRGFVTLVGGCDMDLSSGRWRKCFRDDDPTVEDFARDDGRWTFCKRCMSAYMARRLI